MGTAFDAMDLNTPHQKIGHKYSTLNDAEVQLGKYSVNPQIIESTCVITIRKSDVHRYHVQITR